MTVGARSNSKAELRLKKAWLRLKKAWLRLKKTLAPAQKILAPAQKRLAPGSSGAATLQNEANKSEKMYHFILEILYTQ